MKKKNLPLFSPTNSTILRDEEIANTSVLKAAARNHAILQENFFGPLFEPDVYQKLLQDILPVRTEPALQAQLEEQWENEACVLEGKIDGPYEELTILLRRVRYSCLYIELAILAENDNKRDRAWAFINEASIIVGGILEKYKAIDKKMETIRKSPQNVENAKRRVANFQSTKQEAIRLLHEMKPAGGWKTWTSAASALEEPLGKFIDVNRIAGITSSNARDLLRKNWLKRDPIVKTAWLATKAAKARS